MSSSTLLFKFGAQTRFEALPLPGTAAKLFDVKVAIAKTKKLDCGRGIFDFDLSVKNADTDEEYVNEGMFIARGTRIIVCRRPADHAALQKALLSMNENGSTMRNAAGNNGKPNRMFGRRPTTSRPNADPEIREMEKNRMQKKRVLKSIPRSLRNMMDQFSSSSTANQSGEGVSSGALFQPNKLAFRELVEKSGRRNGLEYALKVTSTPIPEHIQCGICQGVARNAMLLPWDPEGRTACEICIREGLARNGFLRCPLTGEEGVSPDDLLPNVGLRKAAELFVESVMETMDDIENQSADEEDSAVGILDGSVAEQGDVESTMMTTASRKEPQESDGTFGFGGDEFGGDVFAVDEANQKIQPRKEPEEPNSPMKSDRICKHNRDKMIENAIGHAVKSVVNDLSVRTPAQLDDRKAKSPLAQNEGMPSKSNGWDHRERCRRRHRELPPGYAVGPFQGRPYQPSSGNIGGRRNQNYRAEGERLRGRFGADGNITRNSGKKRSHDEHVERSKSSNRQPSRDRICNRESGYPRYDVYRGGPRGRSYGRVDYLRGSNNDRWS